MFVIVPDMNHGRACDSNGLTETGHRRVRVYIAILNISRSARDSKVKFHMILRQQVPHSQCSLRENPELLKNFKSKNSTLKENF
jgi:hypothetical protein